jgi:hypothetical protein
MVAMSLRNYNTISPSARALLLLKSYTTIPYAHQAAQLIQYPEPYAPDFTNRPPGFWIRVAHFEARYWSIDQLLKDLLPPPAGPNSAGGTSINILELSSGFSFRGLALAAERPVYYVDTDLPEVIETKRQLVSALSDAPANLAASPPPEHPALSAAKAAAGTSPNPIPSPSPPGHYELRPLNALDETAFKAIVDSLPPGQLIIVNEGLLMYLDLEEKQRLGALIRKTLQERGGYWITADIYLKQDKRFQDPELQKGDTLQKFLEQHKVDDNMFNSFEEATQLFTDMGFTIDREAEPDYASMTAIPYFMASASPELLQRMRQGGKIHATWRLRPTVE